MPPPRFLVCYLCGQQFGSASLKIHQGQCYAKKLAQWQNAHPSERGQRPIDPETMRSRQQAAAAAAPSAQSAAPRRGSGSGGGFCTECGEGYKPGAKFCQECGHKVQAPPAAPAGPRKRQPQPPASRGGVTQQQLDDFANQEALNMFLTPCRHCGRKFNPDRVQRHETACVVANKKRRAFDSHKARVKDTDMVGNQQTYKREVVQKRGPAKRGPSKWKLQHQEFQNAVQNAKQMAGFVARGGDVRDLPPPPPTINHDYVQCPYCSRSFAPGTAERHIPRCKTTQNRPKPPSHRASASSVSYSQPTRTSYTQSTRSTVQPRVSSTRGPPRATGTTRSTTGSRTAGRTPMLPQGGGGGPGYPDPKSNVQTFSIFGGPTDLPQVSAAKRQPQPRATQPAASYSSRPAAGGGRIVNSNHSSPEMMRAMGGGYY